MALATRLHDRFLSSNAPRSGAPSFSCESGEVHGAPVDTDATSCASADRPVRMRPAEDVRRDAGLAWTAVADTSGTDRLVTRLILEHADKNRDWWKQVMVTNEVRPYHLEHKVLLYVRQSPTHQVLHNREHSALHYAMYDHRMALGWSEIEVIDDDLGYIAAAEACGPASIGWRQKCAPLQGRRRRSARGLALCPQQPELAAADRDVPRGRHGANR